MQQTMTLKEFKQSTGADKPFVIGLDAGIKTGYAIYCRESKEWGVETIDFHRAYALTGLWHPDEVLVIIENPNLNKPVFVQRYTQETFNQHMKIAQNVGANKREASLLIERFRQKGFTVKEIKPTARKWSAEDLKRKTGITARTSEHARDAVRMIFEGGM